MRAEIANALWKRHRRGDITADQARNRVAQMSTDAAIVVPDESDSLLPEALEIAIAHDRTVYDALYVALALAEGCQFVTADRALYNSLASAYPETMLWVEDIPDPAQPGIGPAL
jgi:predicted nucleic acid-binding protein